MKTISHEKNSNAYFYGELAAELAAFASKKTGRPTVVYLSRSEQKNFVENRLRVISKIRTAVNENGEILAADIDISSNVGLFPPDSKTIEFILKSFLEKSFGFYKAKFLRIKATVNFSRNAPKAVDYSILDAQIFFGIECQFQEISDSAGISPKTLKSINFRDDENCGGSPAPLTRAVVVDAIQKAAGPLEQSVKVKSEFAAVTDMNKCIENLEVKDFTPSVFDRKWSSYRLSHKKKSPLSKGSNLKGTAISFSFKEAEKISDAPESEHLSGTAFAFCTMDVEINPLTYKEQITEIKLFINGGRIQNLEAAISTIKANVDELTKIMLNDDSATCDNITVRFFKSTDESKKIGDLVYSTLISAFTSATAQAIDFAITNFPVSREQIFDILEHNK